MLQRSNLISNISLISYDDVTYVYDDVTYVYDVQRGMLQRSNLISNISLISYDDVTYVYDDVTYVYDVQRGMLQRSNLISNISPSLLEAAGLSNIDPSSLSLHLPEPLGFSLEGDVLGGGGSVELFMDPAKKRRLQVCIYLSIPIHTCTFDMHTYTFDIDIDRWIDR